MTWYGMEVQAFTWNCTVVRLGEKYLVFTKSKKQDEKIFLGGKSKQTVSKDYRQDFFLLITHEMTSSDFLRNPPWSNT